MKSKLVAALYSAGVGIGLYAGLFRTIEIISYSEFKGAELVAGGLCCAALALSKISIK